MLIQFSLEAHKNNNCVKAINRYCQNFNWANFKVDLWKRKNGNGTFNGNADTTLTMTMLTATAIINLSVSIMSMTIPLIWMMYTSHSILHSNCTSYIIFIPSNKSVINICKSRLILCKIIGLVIEEFAQFTQLIPLHLLEPSIYSNHLQW